MLFICLLLKTGHQGSISTQKFYKALRKDLPEPFSTKALQISEYFNECVFGEDVNKDLTMPNWGSLLSELRNKIAHRDRIRPSFESDETLTGGVLFNWPTIRGLTYDRFYQYIQNGMYYLFKDTNPILFDVEWKSDHHRDGLCN
jgi:hypothetical protein